MGGKRDNELSFFSNLGLPYKEVLCVNCCAGNQEAGALERMSDFGASSLLFKLLGRFFLGVAVREARVGEKNQAGRWRAPVVGAAGHQGGGGEAATM